MRPSRSCCTAFKDEAFRWGQRGEEGQAKGRINEGGKKCLGPLSSALPREAHQLLRLDLSCIRTSRQPGDALLALLLQARSGGNQRHGLVAQAAELSVLGLARVLELLHLVLKGCHLSGPTTN